MKNTLKDRLKVISAKIRGNTSGVFNRPITSIPLLCLVACIALTPASLAQTSEKTTPAAVADTVRTMPVERTITDTKGRSMEGTITGKTDTQVSFVRKDGQKLQITLDSLSKNDRWFIDKLSILNSKSETSTGVQLTLVEHLGIWVGNRELTWKQYSDTVGYGRLEKRMKNVPEEHVAGRLESLKAQPVSLNWLQGIEYCRKLTEQERAATKITAEYEYTLPTSQEWDGFVGNASEVLASPEEWVEKLVNDEALIMNKPNKYGLYSLIGSRAEWCSDIDESGRFRVIRGHSSCQMRTVEQFTSAKTRDFKNVGTPDEESGSSGMRVVLRKIR